MSLFFFFLLGRKDRGWVYLISGHALDEVSFRDLLLSFGKGCFLEGRVLPGSAVIIGEAIGFLALHLDREGVYTMG